MRTTLYLFLFSIFLTHDLKAESFEIDAFDVKITVSADGYFDVTEVIYARFTEPRHGLFRELPLRSKVNGETFRMRYTNVSVDNWNFTTTSENGKLRIRIGDADVFVDGRQRYEISYRVTGAFLWYDEHIEFNWNLIGNEWEVPIKLLQYRIQFPEDAYFSSEDYGIATGQKGSRESNATIERTGQILRGISTQPLKPGEGVSIAVRLAPDAIAKPAGYRQKYDVSRDYAAMIPAMLAAFILGYWRRFGRNRPDPDNHVPDEYYPPEDLSAAEVGTLFDHRPNTRDVISLIPEWGNQGIVRVRALDNTGSAHEMSIERVSEISSGAPEYQKILFYGLFKDRNDVLVSDLKDSFYKTMSKVKRALKREVRHERLYDMQSYRVFHGGLFLALFFVGLIGGISVIAMTGLILTGILIIALGIIGLVIHVLPPRRTDEGMELKRRLTGLRNFLRDTPGEAINGLLKDDPEYFSRMLPYAVAFGLDKKWIKYFEHRKIQAPIWWYYGSYGMYHNRTPFGSFSESFNMQTVSSAFTSMPSSSGGSGGFSGSSGGGFGGGGGGSW